MSQQDKNRGRRKSKKKLLTEEEIAQIPLIEWKLKDGGRQGQLLFNGWNTNNHSTVYQLLKLYTDKNNKFWVNNIRRALHEFKPPDFETSIWIKFHQLFKNNADDKQYADAMTIILPILATSGVNNNNNNNNNNDNDDDENKQENKENSLEKSFKIFKSTCSKLSSMDKNYKGPSLRCIAALLEICCKNINKKSIEIALNLYQISKDYKLESCHTTSTDYFDYLFKIFACNKTPINEFNILFSEFTKNVNNKIIIQSTANSLLSYFKTIKNVEIYENLISDLNGSLFLDKRKTKQLENITLPKFKLSTVQNSEIWEELRLTQVNDKSVINYKSKELLFNKTRMKKLGNKQVETCTESEKETCVFDRQDEENNLRNQKYNQFIKYMLTDGGAQVIIDGANVGHMIKQDCFSFDFVDHIASYFAFVQNKKVRIILTMYRCINAENCNNERVKGIIAKWEANNWLIKVPNMLYDDVLWSIYSLNSCLIYNGKVIIITNDEMRDHQMALNQKRIFQEFLETKLCQIEIFKDENKLCYDPFIEFNRNNNKKRKFNDFDDMNNDNQEMIKKQKLNNFEFIQRSNRNINQNFHSRYSYIHSVYPYKIHEPYPYVVKPQFYQYENNNNQELIWFLPQVSDCSDIQNPQNMLKQAYSDKIIQQRIRWIVARLKRPLL